MSKSAKLKTKLLKEQREKDKFKDYLKTQSLLKEYNKIGYIKEDKIPFKFKKVQKSKIKVKPKKLNIIQKSSKGELMIAKILNKFNIEYKKEHIFKDLVNPKTNCELRFDFYLSQMNTCIEFDGIQHYEYTPEFHSNDKVKGKFKLRSQQYRDSLKNEYCLNKDIKLIRIKYFDYYKIEDILKSEIINK